MMALGFKISTCGIRDSARAPVVTTYAYLSRRFQGTGA